MSKFACLDYAVFSVYPLSLLHVNQIYSSTLFPKIPFVKTALLTTHDVLRRPAVGRHIVAVHNDIVPLYSGMNRQYI